MRKKQIIGLFFVACFIMIMTVYAGETPEQAQSKMAEPDKAVSAVPCAVAKNARFEFDPVIEGTVILHDYIIENTGNAPLSIENVKTSCGCATASYSKTIQPGGQGKVTIRGNTTGYAERIFSKPITVYTNDPKNRQIKLSLSGKVERFAMIQPRRVSLVGQAGNKIQSVVSITPEKKFPFNIVESYSDGLEKKIEVTLEKKDDKYLCVVNNLMETSGRYRGRIRLKTDSFVKPEIVIYVIGMIKEKKS